MRRSRFRPHDRAVSRIAGAWLSCIVIALVPLQSAPASPKALGGQLFNIIPVAHFWQGGDPSVDVQDSWGAEVLGNLTNDFGLPNNDGAVKIGKDGCVLTAAAMILRYFGIVKIRVASKTLSSPANGIQPFLNWGDPHIIKDLDPGTLNDWLSERHKFIGVGNGFFDPERLVDIRTIVQVAEANKDIPENHGYSIKLVDSSAGTGASDTGGMSCQSCLKDFIDAQIAKGFPVHIRVDSPTTGQPSGHSVLITGRLLTDYVIEDPAQPEDGPLGYSTTLSTYNDRWYRVDAFEPTACPSQPGCSSSVFGMNNRTTLSSANVSNVTVSVAALRISTTAAANLLVTDPSGNRSGVDENGIRYSEIPNSGTWVEAGITDLETGQNTGDAQGFWQAAPQQGTYTIKLSAGVAVPLTLTMDQWDANGNRLQREVTGTARSGNAFVQELIYLESIHLVDLRSGSDGFVELNGKLVGPPNANDRAGFRVYEPDFSASIHIDSSEIDSASALAQGTFVDVVGHLTTAAQPSVLASDAEPRGPPTTRAPTVTTLVSSRNPSVFGQSMTFTAHVAPSVAGTESPAGSVQFQIDGFDFGTALALSGGTAMSDATNALGVGPHSIAAVYSGDGTFDASTATLGEVVNRDNARADSITTITGESPDPSLVGQPFSVSVAVQPVAPAVGTPTGTVSVSDRSTSCVVTLISGRGKCQLIATKAGPITITAAYSGDANFNGSYPPTPPQQNGETLYITDRGGRAIDKVTVDCNDPDPVRPCATGSFNVQYGLATNLPSGPDGLAFDHHGHIVVSNPDAATISLVDATTGVVVTPAVNVTPVPPAFPNVLGHGGLGDLAVDPNSDTVYAIVNPACCDNANDLIQQSPAIVKVSLTTGDVSAFNPDNIQFPVGIAMTPDGQRLFVGTISAVYEVDPSSGHVLRSAQAITRFSVEGLTFDPSTGVLFGACGGLCPFSIGTSANPTLTALPFIDLFVGGGDRGNIAGIAADGLGNIYMRTGSGESIFRFNIASGTDYWLAGDGFLGGVGGMNATGDDLAPLVGEGAPYFGGIATRAHFVDQASTTTSITAEAPDPTVSGQRYSVSVEVRAISPASGTPGGLVRVSDGSESCTVTLTAGGGSCRLAPAHPGSSLLTAAYSGTADFGSSSTTARHQVNLAATTTTVTAVANLIPIGQAVAFTAQIAVDAPGAGIPTGSVQFHVDGANFGSPVGVVTSTASSPLTTALAVGPHTITATYSGDGNLTASAGSLAVTVVNPTPMAPLTTITLTPPPNVQGVSTGDVTVGFHSVPGLSGAQVANISVALTGAETISGSIRGDTGSITVRTDGVTTVTYFATDQLGDVEQSKSIAVTIERGLASYTLAPGYAISIYANGFGVNCGNAGPVGMAFDSVGNLYATDYGAGTLYRIPPGGGTASAATQVNSVPYPTDPLANCPPGSSAGGLAFSRSGRLYMTLNNAPHEVVEVDPRTGAILRQVVGGVCPIGLQTDPLSGDVFFTDQCAKAIERISNVDSVSPVVSVYASTPGTPDGLTISPSGTLYVVASGDISSYAATDALVPGKRTSFATIPFADGIAIDVGKGTGSADALFVNRNDGVMTRLDLGASPPNASEIFHGGSRGDFTAVGPDGCLYATQSTTILRITRADGTCSFAPTSALPQLGLSPVAKTVTTGSPQTLTAKLTNVANPYGTAMTFTVTGSNAESSTVSADAAGLAVFTYTGSHPGQDQVVVSATVGSVALKSNLAIITWNGAPVFTPRATAISYTGATSGDYTDSVTVSARLTDNQVSPQPVSGKVVNITIGPLNCTTGPASGSGGASCSSPTCTTGPTDGAGNASCVITLTRPPGVTTVTASFAGDSADLGSSITGAFSVLPEETVLSLVGPLRGEFNDTITLSGLLTDGEASAVPIAGKTLTLSVGSQQCATGATDSSGLASCVLTIADHAGTVDAHATFAGDPNFAPASSLSKFTVGPDETVVSYTGAASGDFADSIVLSARLSDGEERSSPISGRVLTISIGSQQCETNPTDVTGIASCSVTLAQPPGLATVTVTFPGDSNEQASTNTAPFTVEREETLITFVGQAQADFHDTVVLSGHLTDSEAIPMPITGKNLVLNVGSQSCTTGPTDATGTASCSLTLGQPSGSVVAGGIFAGDGSYQAALSPAIAFTIGREEVSIAYTGPTLLAEGSVPLLRGALLEDGSTPVAGRPVTFSVGTGATEQSCTSNTDSNGAASCALAAPLNQTLGPGVKIQATFGGDSYYLPATATTNGFVFAFVAQGGSFVISDSEASSGSTVVFWGSQWWKSNPTTSGSTDPNFKGFAASPSIPTCGASWLADPGNSTPPPDGPLPAYMAVIVTGTYSKSGPSISGDIVHIVIIKTSLGYGRNPGHRGTGTVVAQLC